MRQWAETGEKLFCWASFPWIWLAPVCFLFPLDVRSVEKERRGMESRVGSTKPGCCFFVCTNSQYRALTDDCQKQRGLTPSWGFPLTRSTRGPLDCLDRWSL